MVARARDLFQQREDGKGPESAPAAGTSATTAQLDLFSDPAAALRRDLAEIEIDSMTPLEALAQLADLRDRARRG